MRIITTLIILLIFLVGCVPNNNTKEDTTTTEFKLNYDGIYKLNEKYQLPDSDNIDINDEKHYMKRRAIIDSSMSLTKGGFVAHVYEYLNSNIQETMKWNGDDLLEFDSFQLYNSINLANCETKIIPSREDYPYTMYTSKCSDVDHTIFIIVVSEDSELAHKVLKEIYSAMTS